jgi:hypothetical protein
MYRGNSTVTVVPLRSAEGLLGIVSTEGRRGISLVALVLLKSAEAFL